MIIDEDIYHITQLIQYDDNQTLTKHHPIIRHIQRKKITPYEAGDITVFIPVLPGTCTGVFLNVYYDGGAGGKYIDKDRQLVVERGKITKVTQVNY